MPEIDISGVYEDLTPPAEWPEWRRQNMQKVVDLIKASEKVEVNVPNWLRSAISDAYMQFYGPTMQGGLVPAHFLGYAFLALEQSGWLKKRARGGVPDIDPSFHAEIDLADHQLKEPLPIDQTEVIIEGMETGPMVQPEE